jgi:hypothetical protein
MVLLDGQPAEAFEGLPSYPMFYRVLHRIFALLRTLARLGIGRIVLQPYVGLPAPEQRIHHDNVSRNLGWQSRVPWTLKPGTISSYVFGQGWLQESKGGCNVPAQERARYRRRCSIRSGSKRSAAGYVRGRCHHLWRAASMSAPTMPICAVRAVEFIP